MNTVAPTSSAGSISKFFIERPVFATVISLVIVLIGVVAWSGLPITQYPEIAPPSIQVTAFYPGASADVVSNTVASPLEQEINGVEGMLYISSTSSNNGEMSLTIVFELGTDLDTAQVLVQNRVAIAEPRLPEEVRRQGITTKKRSPNILLVINLISPFEEGNPNYKDQLYLSNYGTLNIKDEINRLKGVGDSFMFGVRDFSMRIWLDPEKMAARGMNASEVVQALREQNIQVAAGKVGAPPAPLGVDFQYAVNARGRLKTEKDFYDIVVKTGARGEKTLLNDVARVELGSRSYDANNYLDGKPTVGIVIFQRPGTNALETANEVKAEMEKAKKKFPLGIDYSIVYDTTTFVEESIDSVKHTLIEAFVLVFIVVLVFLQDWRATILPMIDVPVSLIGTFAIMAALGFTLNNLTLFGLVLAIGIVVDDAIVVLENVERWMDQGLNAKDATLKAMSEVTGPIIAITLVLSAVFIPTAFITGISGQFYRQFALTIAASTIISAVNAMTMTPSRAVQIFSSGEDATKSKGSFFLYGLTISALCFAAYYYFKSDIMLALTIAFAATTVLSIVQTLGFVSMLKRRLAKKPVATAPQPAEPHAAHHHHTKEAVPWWGLAVLCGYLSIHFLGHRMLGWFNVQAPASFHWNEWQSWKPLSVYLLAALPGAVVGVLLYLPVNLILKYFFVAFNAAFNALIVIYGAIVRVVLWLSPVMLILYGVLMYLTYLAFQQVPGGFIPEQDKGYLLVIAQLPDGANLERTDAVMREAEKICATVPGVLHTISVPGFSLFNGVNISNTATMFVTMAPFEERRNHPELKQDVILNQIRGRLMAIEDAFFLVFGAPPVDGIGNAAGIKFQVQDRGNNGYEVLQEVTQNLMGQGMQQPGVAAMFTTFSVGQPQIFLEIDRVKAKSAGVSLNDAFDTLQIYLGSSYVNDFTFQERNWQVIAQADDRFRLRPEDIRKLKVRNDRGDMVPLGSILIVKDITGPAVVNRYQLYPSADVTGVLMPFLSSGNAIKMMEKLAEKELPPSMNIEWTELSLQEIKVGNTAIFVFVLGTILVYMVLASQYESWSMPLAIILIVPMCLCAAIGGVWFTKGDNNIFTQIGFVVLIGLASKNAILIVEFAKQLRHQGKSRIDAAVEACKLRLRPILMTSLAFILGVLPLVRATGAGSEMRVALGIAVFSGMLGVTIFGIFFTPVFFVVVDKLFGEKAPVAPTKT